MAEQSFELRVAADRPDEYGLALFRRRRPGERATDPGSDGDKLWQLVVRVYGTPMKAVLDKVLATLKHAGYRPSDLSRSRKVPFVLKEAAGVRLGLIFLAVKPLRKTTRMSDVAEHIDGMSDEEAYYWFSKTANAEHGRRSQRALRILMAKE
ncbi:MAG: hypothetical protein K8T91_14555 [Planctomycetes bacterium]|nr:hypothetical protein [Planctomycetota bacterium]